MEDQIEEMSLADYENLLAGGPAVTPTPITKPTDKPFKDKDFPEYQRLVRTRGTTPAQLTRWMEQRGYGRSTNAAEVLTFHRRNPKIKPVNTYTQNPDDPLAKATGEEAGSVVLQTPANSVEALKTPEEWGLSPDTMRWLGYEDYTAAGLDSTSRIARFIKNVPASTANAIYSLMQAGQAGIDAVATAADNAYEGSWLDDKIAQTTGVHQRPSELIGGIPEAFPLGGLELGGFRPSVSKTKVASEPAEGVLARAGIKTENLPEGVTPEAALNALTEMRGIRDEAAAFKGTTNPDPRSVFKPAPPTAEEWGKSLGALEPPVNPVEPRNEPYVNDISPAVVPNTLEDDIKFLQSKGLNPGHFSSEEELKKVAGLIRGREPLEPTSYEGTVSTEVPSDPPALTKAEAGKQFPTAPEKQSPTQWGKSLEAQSAGWKAAREAGNAEPAPPPAARNTTAEVPLVEEPNAPAATPEPAPAADDDVVTRLTNALAAAGKARDNQTALYKEERSRRVAKAGQAIDTLTGEDAIRASSAALEGEMPKADFESVAAKFSQEDVKALQERIRVADTLTVFGKQKAWSGLRKLLHGEIPQGSELKELAQVYPADFIKAAMSNRSTLLKSRNAIQEIWNLPKSLMSTADLSAPLRQGISLVHRQEWRDSFLEMHKYLVSPEKFAELEVGIRKSKYYDKMEEGGLSLPGVYGTAQEVEDAFSSHIAQRLPGIGKINKASERAYVGFLNKLRADTFSNMLDTAAAQGLDINDPLLVKSLAKVINTSTGRGHLGNFEKAANELNMLFFSPRMLKARLETFTNPFDPRLHPFARKEALKSFAATGTYWATMSSLAALAGFSVETDPRSSDFMKAKNGNLRIDFSGGYGPIVVAGARYLTEQSKSLKTGDVRDLRRGGDTAEDAVIKFFRNKLSPTASLIVDAKTGKNSIGEKFEWGPALASRAVPMSLPDILLTLHDKGVKGVPVSVLALYGAGLQNFDENETGERVMDYPYPFTKDAPEQTEQTDETGLVGEMSLAEYEALMSKQ